MPKTTEKLYVPFDYNNPCVGIIIPHLLVIKSDTYPVTFEFIPEFIQYVIEIILIFHNI